jgi:mRNA interferase MazF
VLADAGRGDWILCQVTSNAYADARAVELGSNDFEQGGLQLVSYARPAKLFTAHQSLFVSRVGELRAESLNRITDRIVSIFRRTA